MIIYKTTNLINGKFYIGQDSNNNPEYFGSGILLNRAIEKYGKENFIKEILEYCETKEELNEREKHWIIYYNAKENGYNIADGGHGGNTYTEETKQRISKLFIGRYIHPDTIEKRKKTRQLNPEKYKLSEERKKEIGNFHRGKIISEENKKKLSQRMKNFKNYSTEFLKRQTDGKTGSDNPMFGRVGKLNVNSKPILQLDANNNVIKEWESINLAKKALKLSSIPHVLSGNREFAGGFRWKYK
jgi:group I intron endonuclease